MKTIRAAVGTAAGGTRMAARSSPCTADVSGTVGGEPAAAASIAVSGAVGGEPAAAASTAVSGAVGSEPAAAASTAGSGAAGGEPAAAASTAGSGAVGGEPAAAVSIAASPPGPESSPTSAEASVFGGASARDRYSANALRKISRSSRGVLLPTISNFSTSSGTSIVTAFPKPDTVARPSFRFPSSAVKSSSSSPSSSPSKRKS